MSATEHYSDASREAGLACLELGPRDAPRCPWCAAEEPPDDPMPAGLAARLRDAALEAHDETRGWGGLPSASEPVGYITDMDGLTSG